MRLTRVVGIGCATAVLMIGAAGFASADTAAPVTETSTGSAVTDLLRTLTSGSASGSNGNFATP